MSRFTKAALTAALFSVAIAASPRAFADDAANSSKTSTDSKATTNANVSSRRSLERPLPELKFNAVNLSDVLDFLADSTSSNISVDWKALDEAHVAKDTPITLRMSSQVPLGKVLRMVLQQAGGAGALTFYVDEGVIEITSQEASDKVLITKIYPIQDLLFQAPDYNNAPDLSLQNASQGQSAGGGAGGGAGAQSQSLFQQNGSSSNGQQDQKNSQKDRADEIIKLITDTVKPELWQINGGTATISFFRGNLIVNAPRSIHQMLENRD
jgi:hypothetical protein